MTPQDQRDRYAPLLGSGRRRAQLLAREEGPAARGLTAADVECLRADPSPANRRRIAEKFCLQYEELCETASDRGLHQALLALLARDVAREVRQVIAETLASSPHLPPDIANRLARDEIAVAEQVIRQSPNLTDDDLIAIARTHAMQHALAIAGRETLSEEVCEALTDTGHPQVVVRMLANAGARIAERTIVRISNDHAGNAEVEDGLIQRPALPYEVTERVVGAITERLRATLSGELCLSPEAAERLVHDLRERATIGLVAREHSGRGLERELRRRKLDGELGPQDLLQALREGDVAFLEAGIACLAGCGTASARAFLYGADRRGLACLCIRAGFSVVQYLTLRFALDLAEQGLTAAPHDKAYSPKVIGFLCDQYNRLRNQPDALASVLDAAEPAQG